MASMANLPTPCKIRVLYTIFTTPTPICHTYFQHFCDTPLIKVYHKVVSYFE